MSVKEPLQIGIPLRGRSGLVFWWPSDAVHSGFLTISLILPYQSDTLCATTKSVDVLDCAPRPTL